MPRSRLGRHLGAPLLALAVATFTSALAVASFASAPLAEPHAAPVAAGPTAEAPAPTSPAFAAAELDRVDASLQQRLDQGIRALGLDSLARSGLLGVALVDLSRTVPRFAAVNPDHMIYAASLPKIAILLGALDAVDRGALTFTPELHDELTRMIRVSDNAAASRMIDLVGFRTIADALTVPARHLYDPRVGGGLWVGKAYGRDQVWERDPVAGLSHGATPRQVARFFLLMDQGRLVSAEMTARMREILSNPGIHHKFVAGLDQRPGAQIYRKSGTWHDYHADSALVERPGSRYIAVGLVHDARGSQILERLIVALDDIVRKPQAATVQVAR